MRIMLKKDNEIDPEFLDLIIQSLSVLSNVATIASTWIVLRNRPPASHPGGFAMPIVFDSRYGYCAAGLKIPSNPWRPSCRFWKRRVFDSAGPTL
jgi:hypothetical protein